MHAIAFLLLLVVVLAVALAVPAMAQPAGGADSVDCKAQAAVIEREMDAARSKGQMLRRRQLAESLVALQARCDAAPAPAPAPASAAEPDRAARIEQLERQVQDLRGQLDQAEQELRALKNESR